MSRSWSGEAKPLPPNLDLEVDMAALKTKICGVDRRTVSLSCPDCHCVLREIREGNIKRYRCRTGHAYSRLSLAEQQRTLVEDSLCTSLRALEEYASSYENSSPATIMRVTRTSNEN